MTTQTTTAPVGAAPIGSTDLSSHLVPSTSLTGSVGMHLIHEDLARAQIRQHVDAARKRRTARLLKQLNRYDRRAIRAKRRAARARFQLDLSGAG